MASRSHLAVIAAALFCSAWPVLPQSPGSLEGPDKEPFLADQADFPDGPGKKPFLAACGGCHNINRARAGYTPEGWRMVVRMMQNVDTPISPQDWPVVTEYLIKNFPERPTAVVVPGPVQASIREWQVPTPGSRPHRSAGQP